MKKVFSAIIIYILLLFLCVNNVYAEEIISKKNGLDVIFVIDSSGSMKGNDRSRAALEMVKAFVDTVHIDDMRIGLVVYNDTIVSSTIPASVSSLKKRNNLKNVIDSISYSGNTDIGLGIAYAHKLIKTEKGRNRTIVLISDGETDLGGTSTGRSLKQSNQDLKNTVKLCEKENIPIYTIAFGKYDGSKEVLNKIADDTNAMAYTAQSPEALIEVLYGIFSDNISYKIQEVTDSIYAKGNQEIRYILDEMYLDELALILISPQEIGETTIFYGKNKINTSSLPHYTVGKVTDIKSSVKELKVKTTTTEGQSLKAYLISYRSLTPVLELQKKVGRNDEIPYSVFFKNKSGKPIYDENFYKKFKWNINIKSIGTNKNLNEKGKTKIQEGAIKGNLRFKNSGLYQIKGNLSDNLGSYQFNTALEVLNTPPSGSLPDDKYTILSAKKLLDLNKYFRDNNRDTLEYSMELGIEENADIILKETQMAIKPKKSGIQTVTLFVSDGEDTLAYPYQIHILPLWQAYWWVIVLGIVLLAFILWKIFYKPKPELIQIIEKKAQNHFNGKLDAYFTNQPDDTEEIPPLVFTMYKIKTNKVSLGDLMKDYPEASEALGLDRIYLIADEDRHMILYHVSNATIMIGNSIVCRQLQYSIGFGDVIYITSQDRTYDLEVHYIAMIQ